MKKLLFILLIVTLILNSCDNGTTVNYEPDENFADWLNLEPVIDGFYGELFDDNNITADGKYKGFERLSGVMPIIYCNDDNSVIWRDYDKEAVYRLAVFGQKEKICPNEECRNNIDDKCGHVPVYEFIYSEGILYFTINESVSGQWFVYVYRYNLDTHEYEKLIEFQEMSDSSLALNGRYLYIQTYNWYRDARSGSKFSFYYKVDLIVTRIDLFTETAAVIYTALRDEDTLINNRTSEELRNWRFIDNKIIMPANYDDRVYDPKLDDLRTIRTGSAISVSIIDMRNIETLIDMEDEKISFAFGGDLKLYNGEIYFTTGENGLSRVDMKTGKREIIHKNIQSFGIDGDFLYYMLDGVLYRIQLDYTRELVFQDAIEIYTPEEYSHSWTVHNEYLYAYSGSGLYRIKLNNVNIEPYFFIDIQK
jgi:hypothetical protein